LSGALLDKNKAVVLIEKIEKLAENTNNKVTITIQDVANKKTAKSTEKDTNTLIAQLPSADYLQMKINLTGDYSSIVAFIDSLEKFEYYADITEIKINKDEATDSTSQATSNRGLFDVATQPIINDSRIKKNIANEELLSASLTTVFYTN
jgi:hypothetical protein